MVTKIHYRIRPTYKVRTDTSINKLYICACGHKVPKQDTTDIIEDVTCQACLHTVRLGKLIEY